MDVAAGDLPPLQRLALAYAPVRSRSDWLTLLALDARLASVVRSAREPMIAQLKLAWWRDRLGGDPAGWPKGEPLLARLGSWRAELPALVALVDGWEALLAEPPWQADALEEFAAGRVAALRALAARIATGSDDPVTIQARRWALADAALHAPDPGSRMLAAELLASTEGRRGLPRSMRPLAVLSGLNARAIRRGSREVLDGPGALAAAIRLGFSGS